VLNDELKKNSIPITSIWKKRVLVSLLELKEPTLVMLKLSVNPLNVRKSVLLD